MGLGVANFEARIALCGSMAGIGAQGRLLVDRDRQRELLAGSDEPSAEVEVADAGRAGASATAIEITPPCEQVCQT